MDPNVKPEVLAERLGAGRDRDVRGPRGRHRRARHAAAARQALAALRRGQNVAHWGGRHVWQLADAYDLLVAWKPCKDAVRQEVALLAAFEAKHEKLPFANLRHANGHSGFEEEPE